MFYFFSLWFAIQILSFGILPLTIKLFSGLSDKGYAFSKSVSLVIIGFAVWFLVSLNLFKFSQTSILIVLLILSLFSLVILIHSKLHWPTRNQLCYILFVEALFLIIFSFTAYLKYLTSPIRGTEKPMDFAIINGILRSDYFPPKDAWYSGKTINYYYYGHYLIAFVSKLAHIPSNIIYTLALPLVFSLTGLNIFGLVFNTIRNKSTAIPLGLLAVALVLFGANFDTTVLIIKSIFNGIKPAISWWDPSRVIGRGFLPNSYITITEFPYFSLLLGDVHAHVLALVLGSLFLGVCFTLYKKNTILILLLSSLILASLIMTNPWEVPGYLFLAGLTLIFSLRKNKNHLIYFSLVGLGSLFIFTLPFLNSFEMIRPVNDPKPFVSFISNVALIGRHTLFSEFFTIWGTHLVIIIISLTVIVKKMSPHRFLFIKLPRLKLSLDPEIIFSLLVSVTGISLLIFSEIFFINDFFSAPAERMNTVFKLYFQTWIILGTGSFVLLGNVWKDISKSLKLFVSSLFGLFFVGSLVYFIAATPIRLREFDEKQQNLNGLKFLESGSGAQQGDFASIQWLNTNVKKQFHLLESIIDPDGGNSYSQIGRISAATGLPTVLGWYAVNHEAGWRNGISEINERIADVNRIYQTKNYSEAWSLLKKYQIKYIYVGSMERRSYPYGDFDKFNKIGKLVFSHPYSQIYEVQ